MTITVIIPVYNAKKYLQKAVQSALQFDDVKEIILVEDGCPNGSFDVCKTLLNKDKRIKLYQHPNGENKGAGASRNLGIEKATQEYIAFLDADDYFLPNRFDKDRQIFKNNLKAEGVYNAIGVHFYSVEAKKQFSESFKTDYDTIESFLTTVNRTAKPTAENCFEGLLVLIPNYGYFSLDGLTICKKALKKMNRLIWESSIHEDTDFCIRLAYYLNLYPSEIDKAVTLRGVHEENRITANNVSNSKHHKRFLMWNELYKWSVEEKIEHKYIQYLKEKKDFFYLLQYKKKSIRVFLQVVFKNKKLLKVKNYTTLHKSYFGQYKYSHILYKIRNFVIKYI